MRAVGLVVEALRGTRWLGRIGMAIVTVVIVPILGMGFGLASDALAAEGPLKLWQRCMSNSEEDIRCNRTRGIAAYPKSGHIFVSDQENARVVEFTALGVFIRTWGWDVVASGVNNKSTVPPEAPQFEICVRSDGDICKPGIRGGGAGQFGLDAPQGIAIDSGGNVFVVDWRNHRVEKFDSEGQLLLEFGGEGTGNGQFAWPESFIGSQITVDTRGTESTADDRVYVGDVGRIQRFDVAGVYQDQIDLAGEAVKSLAVDASGDLYVIYHNKLGVHKFSPSGEALAPTFEIPKLGAVEPFPTAVAVDSLGHVYAFGPVNVTTGSPTYVDPIIEFDSSGKIVDEFGKEEFDGSTGLAVNLCPGDTPPGNLYVTNAANEPNAFVRAYGAGPNNCGKTVTGEASNVAETAARLNGRVNPGGEAATECRFEYGTSVSYGNTAPCAESAGEIGSGTDLVSVHADIGGLTKGTVYHVRLVFGTAGGAEAGSDTTFKTLGPPVISREGATHVAFSEATLRGSVNPEGFATKYHFEYGLDSTYGKNTAEIEIGAADRNDHPVSVNLSGLEPGTAYHWRIVARNASGTTEADDRVFTTHAQPVAESCPNDALRTGIAAALPDCRAYEMVSPVDKNGGDILHPLDGWTQVANAGGRIVYSVAPAFGDVQASVNGNRYLAVRNEGEEMSGGWLNHGIHPPVVGEHAVAGIVFGLFREFDGFSQDLCNAWFVDVMTPPLTPDGQEGYVNHYRLDLCGEEEPEALTDVEPPEGMSENYVNPIAGYSADSSSAFFSANAKLDDDAASGTNTQIYDRFGGELHVVSITNKGVADTANTRIGSGTVRHLDNAVSSDGSHVYWTSGGDEGSPNGKIFLRKHPEQSKVEGECTEPTRACTFAVSAASSAFFWVGASDGSGAVFGEATEGGEKLVEFDLQKAESKEAPRRTIASPEPGVFVPVAGVLGAGDDLSHIYFVVEPTLGTGNLTSGSTIVTNVKTKSGGVFRAGQRIEGSGIPSGATIASVGGSTLTLSAPVTASASDVPLAAQRLLTGAGEENSEGDVAQVRQPNIYLDEEGVLTFVGSLIRGEVGDGNQKEAAAYDLVSEFPRSRPIRVSPDGTRLAFESRAPLTDFDNTDPDTGERLVEVYIYEAGGALHCVSCNPSGARAAGTELHEPFRRTGLETEVFASAWIPTWEQSLVASHALSDDGNRIFFNSYDALVPADSNEAMDVYEWEAPGAGSCTKESAAFHPVNGGCIYLISSGTSSFESEFWDASPDGRDVFFSTESSLLRKDPGSVDLYDARVEGGFPEAEEEGECEGEACQSPASPVQDPTPASANYQGPEDLGKGDKCPKGKHRTTRKGVSRCVPNHKKKRRKATKKHGKSSSKRGAER